MTPGTSIYLCGGTLFCVAALGAVADGHVWTAIAVGATVAGVLLRRKLQRKKQ